LERFARFFLIHIENPFLISAAARFFKTYDDFLGLLEDSEMRSHLESLLPEAMDGDSGFQTARTIRTRFEEAIKEIFLNSDSLLYRHTISRGVF
jgi:hypothetical protein